MNHYDISLPNETNEITIKNATSVQFSGATSAITDIKYGNGISKIVGLNENYPNLSVITIEKEDGVEFEDCRLSALSSIGAGMILVPNGTVYNQISAMLSAVTVPKKIKYLDQFAFIAQNSQYMPDDYYYVYEDGDKKMLSVEDIVSAMFSMIIEKNDYKNLSTNYVGYFYQEPHLIYGGKEKYDEMSAFSGANAFGSGTYSYRFCLLINNDFLNQINPIPGWDEDMSENDLSNLFETYLDNYQTSPYKEYYDFESKIFDKLKSQNSEWKVYAFKKDENFNEINFKYFKDRLTYADLWSKHKDYNIFEFAKETEQTVFIPITDILSNATEPPSPTRTIVKCIDGTQYISRNPPNAQTIVYDIDGNTHYLSSIVEIDFGTDLSCINQSAFSRYNAPGDGAKLLSNLTHIIIPGTIKNIYSGAFNQQFISSVVLNEGVESLGDTAFSRCSLFDLTIPSTVSSIGYECFKTNMDPWLDDGDLEEGKVVPYLSSVTFIGKTIDEISSMNNYPWGMLDDIVEYGYLYPTPLKLYGTDGYIEFSIEYDEWGDVIMPPPERAHYNQ